MSFLAGAILSMALIGALFGFAGGMIGTAFGNYWKIGAGLFCLLFGLASLNLLPFRLLSFNWFKGERSAIQGSGIVFGFAVGGLATAFNTCCNPIFPILLAASFVKGSMMWGFLMLTIFALGYSLPLALGIIGIRLGLRKVSSSMSRLGRILQYAGGGLLLIMGFYFLLTF